MKLLPDHPEKDGGLPPLVAAAVCPLAPLLADPLLRKCLRGDLLGSVRVGAGAATGSPGRWLADA